MTPDNGWDEIEGEDPWLEEDDDDSDEDAPCLEDPDDAMSDIFTWFWGEDEGGEESDG